MKLSDFNITNQLHGRWCRFIIHRYLGQFLERNLELNQLSLNLTDGELLIQEVNINVHYVNELLASLKLPLKLIDGFVGEIRVEVPWTSLLSHSTNLKIKDLQLTFQAQEMTLEENDIASMIGSVVDKLVSSQELARSFYAEETQSGVVLDETDGSDGIKAFTKVIDAIVARFCVDLADTTIRLENPPSPNADMCTAIEFRAKNMKFMDEQMKNCRLDNTSAEVITSQPQGIGNITNLNKYVHLSGVELFTDVFSRIDEIAVGEASSSQVLTSMYLRREKLKQKSPTVSPNESLNADLFTSTTTSFSNFQSCHSSLAFNSSINQFDSLQVPRPDSMLLSNPVKFAELSGDSCEIQIQLHNSDNSNVESSDYKANLSVDCKGLNVFISPSQIDILKKFCNALSFPSSKGSKSELGKKMEQNDFDNIVRDIEEITLQGASGSRTNALGAGHGGWGRKDNFAEFTNVNLDETLYNRNGDGSSVHPYVSLKDNSGRKEGTHVKLHLHCLNIVIPHHDILSKDHVEKLPRKHHDAVEELQKQANNFFKHCSHLKMAAHTQIHRVREQFDRMYPQNHLRFVGTSVTIKYDVEKYTQEHMQFILSVNNCDFLEYLTADSTPQEPTRRHYPILDFSEFENPNHVPHLKIFYAASNIAGEEPQAQICFGDCRIELDLSIVDRLADLIVTRPFFDHPYLRNRLGSMSRNQMHLSEDLFSPTIQKESSISVRWRISCNRLTLDLRVPIADLRNPKADRLPYRQRNVHPEFVRLAMNECVIEVPMHEENLKISLVCADITGEFLGVSEEYEYTPEDLTFLFGSKHGSRLVRLEFEYDPRNKSLKASPNIHLPVGIDDMSRSFSTPVLQNQAKREGPFSQVRRTFCSTDRPESVSSLEQKDAEMNGEIIQAGTREEMQEFAESTMRLSTTVIRFDVPLLRLFIVNHPFLEVIYNRLVNDLALWQPAAPSLRGEESNHHINALEEFHSLRQEKEDDDDETIDEGVPTEPNSFDRSKSHTFSFCLNVNNGTLLMGTKMKQNGLITGTGQCVINLNNTQLFTVAGYHNDANRIFFHFTTTKIAVGHRNSTAYDSKGQICSVITTKEFGKCSEDEWQLQNVQKTEQFFKDEEADVIAVALDMHTRLDQNVKDLLLAIAVRNTTIKIKPFRDSGHLWATQLVDLFTLRDYDIPGYELPLVTTDLQLHLDNVVIAYDHKLIQPQSNSRLRFVVGQTHVTSSIITNMDISKFTCIFEQTQLWISNEKKMTPTVRFDSDARPAKDDSFVLVTEVGLLHLDILQCLLPEERLKERKTPLVEIRCRNDVISVWLCADSLVALINIATEISESDAFKPLPEEQSMTSEDEDEVSTSGGDDARSETGASCWSRPASLARPSRDHLPITVEQTLQAMIDSAIREQPSRRNETIPVGVDAVEEFSKDFSINVRQQSLDTEGDRYRFNSLETDEEFCMVDDGVIGAGIAGADGSPTVKFIGKGDPDNIYEDPRHFRIPDEWRSDGLGALQGTFPPPLLRYAIRDISLHINLYSGSDLSKEELRPKSYSVEEYRKGQGKGQKVSESSRGGVNRDQSVFVVLEFNKISYLYQLFNKDAPVMCTQLLSVYDLVVKDKLKVSNINELLYQYSNKGQPRRTCAPIAALRIVESHLQEGRMMLSMLPIKINMDQDTMTFIQDFAEEVYAAIKFPADVAQVGSSRPMIEVPAQITRKRSSLDKPNNLNLELLTPSPVQPPSPLGDLNYLINRGNKSPNMEDISPAPLTSSAISVGNLFGTKSSMSNRTSSPDDSKSPERMPTTSSRLYPTAEELEEDVGNGLNENLFGDAEGDWRSSSEINFDGIMNQPQTSAVVDDLLARSSMEGSFHPQYTEDALVDTSSDLPDDVDNETVCDDNHTEMGVSRSDREHEEEAIRGCTFFKEFTFSPAASIFLDYHGKNRFSMEKGGAVMGVLRGIGQLNQAEIVLKEIHHRHGLLGIRRCFSHAVDEWVDDIVNNLPHVIASCGPISPLVQISKGFMDLFWMPVAEMRKEDGHVVKGIQKGVGSFGLSSAAGIVGIAQSAVGVLQSIAETVLHEVQPDSAYLNRRNRRIAGRAGAPTDLRHGIQLAYGIVSDGVRQTKEDYELAAQEERASGQSGVRSILRFATPAVLRPLVMGTQISYQLLGGLRNQLRPDMYQDERHKWRDDEVPGGGKN